MGLRVAPGARRTILAMCVATQFVLLYVSSSALAGSPAFLFRARPPVYQLVSFVAALVGIAIFMLPAVIGLFCLRWQAALVLALLPWWLAVIAHAGTFLRPSLGGKPSLDHPFWLDPARVGTLLPSLALFAGLGALGWLAGVALASLEARDAPAE